MKIAIKILRSVLHVDVVPTTNSVIEHIRLPFAIKNKYNIYTIRINNIECVILEIDDQDVVSTKKHLELFSNEIKLPIIFCINNITSPTRRYLIDNNIAFVSNDNIYLPQLLIYLTPPKENRYFAKNRKLSKLSQQIIIFYIVHGLKELDIEACAKMFKVTKMSAGRALNELCEFDIFSLAECGRTKIYHLSYESDIEHILSCVKTPKVKVIYADERALASIQNLSESSYSALSHYTDIMENSKTFAIDKKFFDLQIAKSKLVTYYERAYGNDMLQIEIWKYDPADIQPDVVDEISLYLSMKDELYYEDTRAMNAYNELKNRIIDKFNAARNR